MAVLRAFSPLLTPIPVAASGEVLRDHGGARDARYSIALLLTFLGTSLVELAVEGGGSLERALSMPSSWMARQSVSE